MLFLVFTFDHFCVVDVCFILCNHLVFFCFCLYFLMLIIADITIADNICLSISKYLWYTLFLFSNLLPVYNIIITNNISNNITMFVDTDSLIFFNRKVNVTVIIITIIVICGFIIICFVVLSSFIYVLFLLVNMTRCQVITISMLFLLFHFFIMFIMMILKIILFLLLLMLFSLLRVVLFTQ